MWAQSCYQRGLGACRSRRDPRHCNPIGTTRGKRRLKHKGYVCDDDGSIKIELLGEKSEVGKTYHFDVLQCILFRGLQVGLLVDVWHVTPVMSIIVFVSCWRVGLIESKAIDACPVHDRVQIIDQGLIWWIPCDTWRIRIAILSLCVGC